MRAMALHNPALVETAPLVPCDLPLPEPADDEVRVRVHVCGICRTDLHVVEGDLAPRLTPIVPGHQAVGVVDKCGARVRGIEVGSRVGIAWLHRTCGKCEYCATGQENLCAHAKFTGYTHNGGFAEYVVAPAAFVHPLPEGFSDLHAAPLLCAGIIGFRCLRVSGIRANQNLGLYGFGAAAHVAIQVAQHWGARVFVCTRDERHRVLARSMGAAWVGAAAEPPPEPLDAAIIFAPAGELVPAALATIKRGGMVVLGGIHMSPIPQFPYELLYGERVLRSVMNNTREDGRDFLRLAAAIPIHTRVETFPLDHANQALAKLKNDAIEGAAVLTIV